MLEGNYKNKEILFEKERFRTFFGERSYGQIQNFLDQYMGQKNSLDTFYLLRAQCIPKVDRLSVGDKSKRWKLSLVADYITIHKYVGSLLTLEDSLIDHSKKWDKKTFLISMDVRNRINDKGKNRYQFRNISFVEVVDWGEPSVAHLLGCSDREKLLHEIATYDSKSIKAEARIKGLGMILGYLKNLNLKKTIPETLSDDLNLNN